MLELQRAQQQYYRLFQCFQPQATRMNDGHVMMNASATRDSALSRRILPNGSPKVAEKRKAKRKHPKNIRLQNQYIVKAAVKADMLILCKKAEDDCPQKAEGCGPWHDPNDFIKHWFCKICFKWGKFNNNAHIMRHIQSGPHIEWYNESLKLSFLFIFSFLFGEEFWCFICFVYLSLLIREFNTKMNSNQTAAPPVSSSVAPGPVIDSVSLISSNSSLPPLSSLPSIHSNSSLPALRALAAFAASEPAPADGMEIDDDEHENMDTDNDCVNDELENMDTDNDINHNHNHNHNHNRNRNRNHNHNHNRNDNHNNNNNTSKNNNSGNLVDDDDEEKANKNDERISLVGHNGTAKSKSSIGATIKELRIRLCVLVCKDHF